VSKPREGMRKVGARPVNCAREGRQIIKAAYPLRSRDVLIGEGDRRGWTRNVTR
jgi:hypothetical protein